MSVLLTNRNIGAGVADFGISAIDDDIGNSVTLWSTYLDHPQRYLLNSSAAAATITLPEIGAGNNKAAPGHNFFIRNTSSSCTYTVQASDNSTTIAAINVGETYNFIAKASPDNWIAFRLLSKLNSTSPGGSTPLLANDSTLKTITAGDGITFNVTANDITIVNARLNVNVGGHAKVFKEEVGGESRFRTLQSSTNTVSITENTNDIDIKVEPAIIYSSVANIEDENLNSRTWLPLTSGLNVIGYVNASPPTTSYEFWQHFWAQLTGTPRQVRITINKNTTTNIGTLTLYLYKNYISPVTAMTIAIGNPGTTKNQHVVTSPVTSLAEDDSFAWGLESTANVLTKNTSISIEFTI